MKFVSKKVLLFFIALSVNIPAITALQINDLMLLLASKERSEERDDVGAFTSTLAQAIYEKAAPIIASGLLVRNYLWIGKNPEAIKGPWMNDAEREKFCAIKLYDDDWYGYYNSKADLVLLVPKAYITIVHEIPSSDPQALKACGFNVKDNKQWVKVSVAQDKLSEKINPKTPVIKNSRSVNKATAEGVKTILMKSKDSKWNIYWCGHGDPALNEYGTRGALAKSKQPNFLASDDQFAGVPFYDFVDLMKFFQDLNISLLCLTTCHSGGRHQEVVNKLLDNLGVTFLFVFFGVNESWTRGDAFESNFTEFFNELSDISKKMATTGEMPKTSEVLKDLAKIVEYVVTKERVVSEFNHPFVRIPGKGILPISINEKVQIITKDAGNSIDATDKEALLIYPAKISSTVKMGNTALISLRNPKVDVDSNNVYTIPLPYGVTHWFEKIEAPDLTREQVLLNLIKCNGSIYKTFLIEHLICNDGEFEKVILNIVGERNEDEPPKFLGKVLIIMQDKKNRVFQATLKADDNFYDCVEKVEKTEVPGFVEKPIIKELAKTCMRPADFAKFTFDNVDQTTTLSNLFQDLKASSEPSSKLTALKNALVTLKSKLVALQKALQA